MKLAVTVSAEKDSPRLRFALDWLLVDQLGLTYQVIPGKTAAALYSITYGTADNGIYIPASGLLKQSGIQPTAIEMGTWQTLPVFFYQENTSATIPFDLLSAIFYLLSRYEEYLPFTPDSHGRYPHTESLLSKEGWLEHPLLDEWVERFRQLLEEKWNLSIPKKTFTFRPTYDIDIAWSYRHKGWKRLLGASLRDVSSGKMHSFIGRIATNTRLVPDPYDAFSTMKDLHVRYSLQPHYFILAALNTTAFDKNIHPHHPAMQQLIRSLQAEGAIGMHPSYHTATSSEVFIKEQQTLATILHQPVTTSRQHYIRLRFPETYRLLLAHGIKEDFSMGYSTHLGFRAGTSRSFYWYDLQEEQTTALRIHPFCFMDTTAHYDEGLSVTDAFLRLRQMRAAVQQCGGTLTTIFHNFSLGTAPEWRGWRAAYEAFIKETVNQ